MSGSENKYVCYDVRMSYQAGYAQFKDWTSGKTVHAGVGWFHPFGPSHYFCGREGFEEAKNYPLENYFSDWWMETFDTRAFCVYRLADGDIYAWDGIFAVRDSSGDIEIPHNSSFLRRDVLTNIIVGGTGAYEGAIGIMTGTAEGGGEVKTLDNGLTLPEGLLKVLSGYIKIPIKK